MLSLLIDTRFRYNKVDEREDINVILKIEHSFQVFWY